MDGENNWMENCCMDYLDDFWGCFPMFENTHIPWSNVKMDVEAVLFRKLNRNNQMEHDFFAEWRLEVVAIFWNLLKEQTTSLNWDSGLPAMQEAPEWAPEDRFIHSWTEENLPTAFTS